MAINTIKPKQGLKVRDPATGEVLPEAGKTVTWNSYWQRRLQDGSIFIDNTVAKHATKNSGQKTKG